MFEGNKLISNIPRGPAKATELNPNSTEENCVVFDEDHDFNLKVSYVYEYESAVHDNAIKKCIINGLHSGISDKSLPYVRTMFYYLSASGATDMYETRKLQFYAKEGV